MAIQFPETCAKVELCRAGARSGATGAAGSTTAVSALAASTLAAPSPAASRPDGGTRASAASTVRTGEGLRGLRCRAAGAGAVTATGTDRATCSG
ncbi:hypothetical protein ADK93_31035 [Streptomyces sp. XY58]|nr:hypothetical protein ADK93_31035 [Streptomyces sp. XY58]